MKLKNTRKGGIALLSSGIKISSFFIFLLLAINSSGQVTLSDSVRVRDSVSIGEYPFINYEADTLLNAGVLMPFFKKLRNLENGDSSQVSILHIGDSHIQADFITREVRKNLQLRFGNAGRGLVFPLRVAGTNEPSDYKSTTNTSWTIAKVNSQAQSPEPGISGISMSSGQSGVFFDITTLNHDELDYAFTTVTLIHAKDSLQFDCRFTDSPPRYGYLMSALPMEPGECTTVVPFSHHTNYVRLQAEQTEAGQKSMTVNGVILQNNKPGILYHSVGINGAKYEDYLNSPLFFTQLKVLKPDLVIVSLGTNEGANVKVKEDEMITSVTSMLQRIRSANPETCILITTPTDNYYKKKYKNPYLQVVHSALVKSAELEHVACWDLYTITGGYGSNIKWRKALMLQRDGVHFNKQGYTLQGALLYKALTESYLKYAAD